MLILFFFIDDTQIKIFRTFRTAFLQARKQEN